VLENDDFLPGTFTSIENDETGTAKGTISFDALTGECTYIPSDDEVGSTVTINYVICNTAISPFVCVNSTLKVSVLDVTSIDENGQTGLIVYPNPANSVLYLSGIETMEQISVCNLSGEEVYVKQGFTNQIHLDNMPNGIYLLKVKTNTQMYIQRFVVNK